MKIIKQGINPADDIYEGECNNCHSIIEAKCSELEFKSDFRNGGSYASTCLLEGCNHTVYFKKKDNQNNLKGHKEGDLFFIINYNENEFRKALNSDGHAYLKYVVDRPGVGGEVFFYQAKYIQECIEESEA